MAKTEVKFTLSIGHVGKPDETVSVRRLVDYPHEPLTEFWQQVSGSIISEIGGGGTLNKIQLLSCQGLPEDRSIAGVKTYGGGGGTLSFARTGTDGKTSGGVTVAQAAEYMRDTADGKRLAAENWSLIDDNGYPALVNKVERIGKNRLCCWLYGEHEYWYEGDSNAPYLLTFWYRYKGSLQQVVMNYSLLSVLRHFVANEEKLKTTPRIDIS